MATQRFGPGFLVIALAGLCACSGGHPSQDASSSSASGQSGSGTDVTTYKNDVGRTGQNLTETTLTTANVNSSSFGLLRMLTVDSSVDAQPLYLSQFSIAGAAHDVVFVATEKDSVYAFDVNSGATLWQVSLLGSGETPSDTHDCGQIVPSIGITATPVIDRAAGTIFVVAMSEDSAGAYHQRLHALNLTSGAELSGSPVNISAAYTSAQGSASTFDPGQYAERAALLLTNGTLYTSWTSHCDAAPYGGWVIAYSEKTLAQTAVINLAANSTGGPAIWMSGGGPAVDATGNIFLLTANGGFETTLDANGFPSQGDYGNSFVKLSTAQGGLAVADYFAMSNEVSESGNDVDLGSGGEMLLPDLTDASGATRQVVVGAGKDSNIYVVDRSNMGKFSASGNQIWQELDGVLPGGVWATPAYFSNTVYYGDNGGTLKAFAITQAKLATAPSAQTTTAFAYPGTSPAISANGTGNGILWAHENTSPAVLHAYDATDLSKELYNSSQAANGRDQFGAGNKFITPTIADGKVMVGTQSAVAVFGLL